MSIMSFYHFVYHLGRVISDFPTNCQEVLGSHGDTVDTYIQIYCLSRHTCSMHYGGHDVTTLPEYTNLVLVEHYLNSCS